LSLLRWFLGVLEVLVVGGDARSCRRRDRGARRRWPFRREGPNGSALLLEVRLLNSDRARVGRRKRGVSHHPRS
ncbi:hypothetical protein Taro_000112, partial [Colocasia esculenta]|nr:hypothetical protein [Colocasia esculenta]